MDKNGNVIYETVSGNDGLVSFLGLGYGENGNDVTTGETKYYVVETYTPNNYNLLAEPVEVTVNQTSYLFENTQLTVVNSIKTVLPMTGGTGTMMFYAIGGLIVLAGGTSLIVIKKRKTKAN